MIIIIKQMEPKVMNKIKEVHNVGLHFTNTIIIHIIVLKL
jgi:hypothetical protein